MFDLQVVRVQDVIALTKTEVATSDGVRLYRLHGTDFRSVEEVWLNGFQVEDFSILSRTRLVAVAPPGMREEPQLLSAMVLSAAFTATERSILKFQLTHDRVDGLLRLSQLFAKVLLSAPGTDIYAPKMGGNLPSLIGSTASKNGSSMTAAFTQIVNRTKQQVLAFQASRPRIPIAERLASARVVAVNFDPGMGELQGRVQLASVGGRAAVLNLGI